MAKTSANGFAAVVPEYDAQGVTADEFMALEFEWEYCHECMGDTEDHTAVIGPFGSWFAYCNAPEKDHEAARQKRTA
jgi:hypothetical protein